MAKTYLGVDIGANKIGIGLVRRRQLLSYTKVPTRGTAPRATILKNILTAITTAAAGQRITGVGVGIAGQVDHAKGVFVRGANFSSTFTNIPLAELIKTEVKCKRVALDNDAHCFTLAEAALGAGQPYRHIVGITLGTGVGGGIVIDGVPYRGAHGLAGEIGHLRLGDWRLEERAAGKGMSTLYYQRTRKKLDSFAIEQLARAGDAVAVEVFRIMSTSIAMGLASIAHALNPEIIVIGGGLIRVPLLITPALKQVKSFLIYPTLTKTKITLSRLGDKANVLGATLLVD